MSPTSVPNRFGVAPFREFPDPCPAGSHPLIAQMIGQLRPQPSLQRPPQHLRQEPASPVNRNSPVCTCAITYRPESWIS